MKKILFTNAGLCRGREPEYKYLKKYADVSIMAYDIKEKQAEKRYTDINTFYPPIKPLYYIDPIYLIRRRFSVMSIATFYNIDKIISEQDIIVTQDPNFFTFGITKIANKLKKNIFMINFENSTNISIFSLPPYRKIVKYILENTQYFIPQSTLAAEFLTKRGVKSEKMKVIYPGIDINIFYPKGQKNNNEDLIQFLFVGTLTKNKGLDDLLFAYENIHKRYKNTKLVIVGKGPMENLLNSKIKKNLSISHYKDLDVHQLSELYRNSDVFVLFSKPRIEFGITIWLEQFSYSLLEAMSSGLPIITTNVGAIPEVVSNKNIIVDYNNRHDLIKKMEYLIEHPGIREELGKYNRERTVNLFDAEKQAKNLMLYLSDHILLP
ncbi:MAG: glycosyltransferase family 4 protein [Saccharolobus sp.]